MGVTRKIGNQISNIANGTTFKYDQLEIEPQEFIAAAKAIERLIDKGIIKRVSTGIFYKPKKTVFGELKPSEEEIIKPYLFEKGKRVAYITGTALYNRMGLTTQIPKSIKISSRTKRITVSIGSLKATPVKSYVDVTDKNFYLLELLDALKDFKQIPDLDKESAIKIITNRFQELNITEIKQLITYSLAYPPRARSMLGSLLEKLNTSASLIELKESLNPFSSYNLGVGTILPTAKNWNIQ